MDADQVRQLKPMLTRYLRQFDDCFARRDTRVHFSTYVQGQSSDLREKSCEPMALAAGVPPRNLQEFLATYKWEEDRTRERLQEMVVREHCGPNSIRIVDETSDVRKGDKTPGVQRQWCGTVGKTENCIVTVHFAYATGDFHCPLDGDLFLPEDWSADRDRCRAAGIPEDVVYRPKWKIALDLFDRARRNGVLFDWLTCDEGYGGKPAFLRQLQARGQVFVAEVPTTFSGWIHEPRVTSRPLVWEVKPIRITIKDEKGFPGMRSHLLVAFSRWRVERCFEDQKQEVGLDQWEGRRWLGLKRHLILSCVSYLFLARVRKQLRENKPGADHLPGAYGGRIAGAKLVAQRSGIRGEDRGYRKDHPALAAAQRCGTQVPHQTNTQETAEDGHLPERPPPLYMAMTLRSSARRERQKAPET